MNEKLQEFKLETNLIFFIYYAKIFKLKKIDII